jgi:hypothetical protein
MKRYKIKTRIAPPTAIKRLLILNPVTVPNPRWDAMKPPTKAPTIPNRIVMIKPPGSLPGMMNFASKPTINPITIHDRISIANLLIAFLDQFQGPTGAD